MHILRGFFVFDIKKFMPVRSELLRFFVSISKIRRLINDRTKAIAAPMKTTMATFQNRPTSVSCLGSNSPAICPAAKLPNDEARNHTPSIKPTIFPGASLVIELKPTGLRKSSSASVQKINSNEPHRADFARAGQT